MLELRFHTMVRRGSRLRVINQPVGTLVAMQRVSGRVQLDVSVAVILRNHSATTVLPAQTVDASASGARIKGFSGCLQVGQQVTLAYRDRECAFRVAWIGTEGSPLAGQIGMEALESQKEFWNIEFVDIENPGLDALIIPWETTEPS